MKESKYVGRVKFPTDIPIHGKFLNYTGYGVTQAATTNYRRLQKLRFQVKDPRACSRDHQMYVTEDKLCAIHWSARNRCWVRLDYKNESIYELVMIELVVGESWRSFGL